MNAGAGVAPVTRPSRGGGGEAEATPLARRPARGGEPRGARLKPRPLPDVPPARGTTRGEAEATKRGEARATPQAVAHPGRYPTGARVRAKMANGSIEAGSTSASRAATSDTFAPVRMRLTGTSSFFPVSVRGIAGTATIVSGA